MAEILLGISSSRSRPSEFDEFRRRPLSLSLSIAARFLFFRREISRPEITRLRVCNFDLAVHRGDSRVTRAHLPCVSKLDDRCEIKRERNCCSRIDSRNEQETSRRLRREDFPGFVRRLIKNRRPGDSDVKAGDHGRVVKRFSIPRTAYRSARGAH